MKNFIVIEISFKQFTRIILIKIIKTVYINFIRKVLQFKFNSEVCDVCIATKNYTNPNYFNLIKKLCKNWFTRKLSIYNWRDYSLRR